MSAQHSAFKSTTIPLSGYVYQNLVGLRLLCDWLDDPGLFDWIEFEADHDEIPQGLDDLVAHRTDGTFVLLQIKFTVNANDSRNALTWDWLLAHKPNGRSLLQKWCDALSKIRTDSVHTAALITNRVPCREFMSTIDSSSLRVQLANVDPAVRAEVANQLGGESRANAFFDRFEIQHSYQGAEALERTIVDRFIPRHTDRLGWLALFRDAIDWAVRRSFPLPRGRITLDILRGTLDARRPRPIEQSFHLPDGYQPPDEEFAAEFLRNLGKTKAVVLWGAPGQGKSTFLSNVCRSLGQNDLPYIRHHYFLILGDRSDRFTLASVAHSLISQMEVQHFSHVQGLPTGPEHLRRWIEACARGYKSAGKRFVVVIDGLDHVWRENDRNKQPLDSLFNALLPVPDNVTLIVGTQKVSEAQLPSHFGRFVKASAWKELPRMSLVAIESWLRAQLQAGRFELPPGAANAEDVLVGLTRAFHEVTGSHPLVLTYTFEALIRQRRTLDPSDVRTTVLAPDGDIKRYYGMLWQQLSPHAKDALHLLADSDFVWPALGLEACLGIGASDLTPAIGHLLHNTEAGQVAFHGSLYAFVRDVDGHSDRIDDLLLKVVAWLQTHAPNFHRWGWQWLYEARAGNPTNLLNGPDRNWVIESLASAYPKDQIEAILGRAEAIAFGSGDFAKAIRTRWLKTRVHNGPQFQIDDYEMLHACALRLTGDGYPMKTLAARLQTASIDRLHLLGSQYLLAGRRLDAIECLSLMRRRINDRARLGAYAHDEYRGAIESWLHLSAGTCDYDAERIIQVTRRFQKRTDEAGLFEHFLSELIKQGDLAPLMEFVNLPMTLSQRTDLELASLRLAGALRAHVHEWPEFVRFTKHPLSSCWRLLYQKGEYKARHFNAYEASLDAARPYEAPREVTQRHLHRFFFARLARCLSQRGARVAESAPIFSKRAWLTEAAQHMAMLADAVGALLARHEDPAFALPFRLLDAVKEPAGYEAMTDYVPFRKALTEISGDLFLLKSLRSGLTKVSSTEWARAKASRHFGSSNWCDRFAGAGMELLDRDVVAREVEARARSTSAAVSPFNDRAANYVELCQLATNFGLRDQASSLLRRSLSSVIGYGWRKDPTISFGLDAIRAIVASDRAFATKMLRRLIPIVLPLGEMTEDAGTRASDLADLIIDLIPEVFSDFYNHLLMASEWYTAEEAFSELLSSHPLDDQCTPLLGAALWGGPAIGALRKRVATGDVHAQALLTANAARFGLPIEDLGRGRVEQMPAETEEPDIDVTAYAVTDLYALQEDIRARKIYVGERRLIQRWFEHWLARGQGIALLRNLQPLCGQQHVASGIADILDQAFETSLRLEGKKAAYRWLIAAQIHCRGWDDYRSQDEALRRFATVASHYKDRWQEFIYDTTRLAGEPLSIPHHRLAHFLLVVGQVAAARGVIEAVVDTTVDDFADQPLSEPTWLEKVRS